MVFSAQVKGSVTIIVVILGLALDSYANESAAAFDPLQGVRIEVAEDATIHLGARLGLHLLGLDDRNRKPDGFYLDRALLVVEAELGESVCMHVGVDGRGIDTQWGLREAWVGYEVSPALQLQAGLLRTALGVEAQIPDASLPFTGYAFPAQLTTRTDWGLRLSGTVAEGVLDYMVSAGLGRAFDSVGKARSEPQLAGLATLRPLAWLDWTARLFSAEVPLVSGFFFSFGTSWAPGFDGHLRVQTPLRNTLFMVDRFEAGQTEFRHIAYGLVAGPLRLGHEFVKGGYQNLRTPLGTREDFGDQVTAWEAMVSVMLTGEHYRSTRAMDLLSDVTLRPRAPLYGRHGSGERGGWGALELAVRYSNADIDRRFFYFSMTDYNRSSQEFRIFSTGLTWYPAANFRATLEVVRVIADQYPLAFASKGRDTSGVLGLEFRF